MILNIKTLDRLTVACVRHTGTYDECERAWDRLLTWANDERLLNPQESLFLGICHDDPALTEPHEIRYDACITLQDGTSVSEDGIAVREIGGMDYVSFLHCGPYEALEALTTKCRGTGWHIQDRLHRDRALRSTSMIPLRPRRISLLPKFVSRWNNA